MNSAPQTKRIAVEDKASGRVFEAWSVDAREMVTMHPERFAYAGAAPATSPGPIEPGVPAEKGPDAAAEPDAEERLANLGYTELQELARRVGIPFMQKKPALIAALLPHVEGSTLSLTKASSVLGMAAPPPQ